MDQTGSSAASLCGDGRRAVWGGHLAIGRFARGWLAAIAGLLALGLSAPAAAQITYTNSTDGPVNETATPCSNPLLRTFSVPIHFTVADANIGILMAHTYRGDLRYYLSSPDGTRVTLGENVGGTRNNLNVLFDDGAAAAYTSHTGSNDTATAGTVVPPYQRTFRPTQALSAFNGQDAFGTWTLEICDSLNVDSGTFYQSDLILTAANATIVVDKTHVLVSDPVGAPGAPYHLPGAVVRYCLTFTNAGPGIAHSINSTDVLPATTNFVAGSIRSGATCATTTTVEDDDASGADESDPVGANRSGSTITVVREFMTSGSFAVTFEATVN